MTEHEAERPGNVTGALLVRVYLNMAPGAGAGPGGPGQVEHLSHHDNGPSRLYVIARLARKCPSGIN